MALSRCAGLSTEGPRVRACGLWLLMAEAGDPREADEFRVFVGIVSEIQHHPEEETADSTDILEQARAALARHAAG